MRTLTDITDTLEHDCFPWLFLLVMVVVFFLWWTFFHFSDGLHHLTKNWAQQNVISPQVNVINFSSPKSTCWQIVLRDPLFSPWPFFLLDSRRSQLFLFFFLLQSMHVHVFIYNHMRVCVSIQTRLFCTKRFSPCTKIYACLLIMNSHDLKNFVGFY